MPQRPGMHRMGAMRSLGVRRAGLIAWPVFAFTALMAAGTAAFGFLNDGTVVRERGDTPIEISAAGELTFASMVLVFALLGALLASRRPGNRVAWILCVSPVFLAATGVAGGWYIHTEYAEPGAASIPALVPWAANWAWIPGFMPLLTFLLLLFPEGRPPTPRWRAAGGLAALAMATLVAGYAFAPGPLEDYERFENPLGLGGAAGDVAEVLVLAGFPLFSASALACMASLVVRFRRSRGAERQQVKWMAAAAALVVLAWFVNAMLDQLFKVNSSFFLPLVLLSLPAATTVAVLRYRLYDLDLVVNRALVYGGLTALLAGSYLGLVLLLQLVLSPQSDLAIAGSTLAVAALVRPARRRIQAIVDRRFYRRRYDAAQTVEAFGGRLRDQVELDALSGELRGVVSETMQPAHVSVWLRQPEGAR